MCILEQLKMEWESKLRGRGRKYLLVSLHLFQSIAWIRAGGRICHSMDEFCSENLRGFKIQASSFICTQKPTLSNSTVAVGGWLKAVLEGRALQPAPPEQTSCSQAVSAPCTQTCLTLLCKHNIAEVMRIMLQAENEMNMYSTSCCHFLLPQMPGQSSLHTGLNVFFLAFLSGIFSQPSFSIFPLVLSSFQHAQCCDTPVILCNVAGQMYVTIPSFIVLKPVSVLQ